jgi:hypothetical protein
MRCAAIMTARPLYVRDLIHAKKAFAEFSHEILLSRSLQKFVEET